MPEISVVVPTRDRPAALAACLRALDAQTAAARLEVIVVDDGSADPSAVAGVVATHPSARLVRRDTPGGPAAARNTGARTSTGTILCFTDDDCVAEPEWAERLAAAIRDGADGVGGAAVGDGGALAAAWELVADAAAAPRSPFAPSGSLACTRAAFDAVPFDESFLSAAGEDREWSARLVAAGYELRSEPRARVVHRQLLTPLGFLRQQFRYGQAAYRFRSRAGRPSLEPIGFYAALLRRAFAQGAVVGTLVVVAQLATAAGFTRAWSSSRRSAS